MMRRFPVLVAFFVLMPLLFAPAALAQEATPVATFPATLGLPELRITITDTGFDAPSEVAAGRVLLTVTNTATPTGDSADADFVRLPDGTTIDDVAAFFGPQMATPSSMEEAAPDWIYEATFAGGPIVPPGQSMQAIVELTPGEWILLNDIPGAQQPPQSLTVTESAASPTAMEEPQADVDVQLQEYSFVGLENPIPAGPHLWKFTNTGTQPHVMILFRGPAGITMNQVMTLLQLPEDATPPADFPYQESDFDFSQPGLDEISPGQTSWLALDLAPGTYIALCFVPDEETGVPHALMGMVQVFTVGEGMATPAA
jgi:hypothetical protein